MAGLAGVGFEECLEGGLVGFVRAICRCLTAGQHEFGNGVEDGGPIDPKAT